MKELFAVLEKEETRFLKFWEDICNIEGESVDKDALDEVADFIEKFAKKEGFTVKRTPFEKCGDFLCIDMNENAEKGYMFLAHMDTVHEKGKFGYPPVKIEGTKMIGPGVIDCKGGIAVALLAMKALKSIGYEKHLRLILTSDEEVSTLLGGSEEIEYIRNATMGFKGAFNCEVGKEGEVVVSRKGILRLDMIIHGQAAHSGIDYFAGKSAVREAAYKIIEIEKNSCEGGNTYNCGIIQGGELANIVPPICKLVIDVRATSVEGLDEGLKLVQKIADTTYVEGTHTEMSIRSRRLPMVHNKATDELFDKLNETSIKYGFGELKQIESGGGSDSAYTQLADVPSVCAVGTCGDFCHTVNEYADIDSLLKRAKLLAATISEN